MTVKSSTQTVHILGPGAMGLLWASHLANDGWDVTLLLNRQSPKNIVSIHYQSTQGKSEHTVKQQSSATGVVNLETLIITVKAYQLCAAIKPLIPKINKNTLIILTQNGIGSEAELYQKFPEIRNNRVLQAVTSHGALKYQQNHVQQTGFGFCWIGNCPKFHHQQLKAPKSNSLEALLKLKMINGWRDDIEELTWQKLIINASINPLATILGCSNGELLSRSLLPLIKEIVIESSFIARQTGFITFDSALILEKVKQVCRDTTTNKNSMLVDVINHRPTEIGYINQFLLNKANNLGIDAPWNLCLTSILNTINHVKMHQ